MEDGMRMTEALAAKAEMLAGDDRGDPARRWYAVRAATRQEVKLEDGLKQIGVEFFQPKWTFWRRLRSKKTRGHRPLFPGYLFVLCTPNDFFRIHEVDGFHQFVRITTDGGLLRPMAFPDEAVGDLMMRHAFGEWDETKSKPGKPVEYRPAVGDKVIITGGTWFDYVAEVLSLSPAQRQAKVRIDGLAHPPKTVTFKNLSAA